MSAIAQSRNPLSDDEHDEGTGISPSDAARLLAARWKLLLLGPILAGLAAFGIASLIPPTFTAKTTLLPPQQSQSSAATALSQLGALAGLAGGTAAIRSPADQYVALMQSVSVTDRIVEEFKLLDVYDVRFREDARRELANNVRISAGKKDGLIVVEVDDGDRDRAAAIANALVAGLRQVTSNLAISEAQQRRVFFETQLQQAKEKLTLAQIALQASGINEGALKAEPKAAAEGYARLRAELTSAEIRFQAMRRILAENSPELSQQQAVLRALRDEIDRLERQVSVNRQSDDYITKYREFKYQETLFELLARQYELARLDESREGALIQVVDVATSPERKSKPKRGAIAMITTLLTGISIAFVILARRAWLS
jgi:uncharacterized protein involved in exopolysaccharide biosynthesis